jgi:hypothetical protein
MPSRRRATRRRPRALAQAAVDVAQHALLLHGRHQRADLGARVDARTDLHARGDARELLHHRIETAAMHVEARARRAHLALVEEDRLGRPGRRHRRIGIVQHDHRALAPQLQGHPGHVVEGRLAHQLADLGGAGEGHLLDALVGSQRSACRMAQGR